MKWPRLASHEEYVNQIERQLRWRGPVAIVLAVLAGFYVGCSIYFFHIVESGVFPFVEDQVALAAFQFGIVVGYFGGMLAFFAVFSCFFAVYSYFARRKDQLLVKYHRRLAELGELPE